MRCHGPAQILVGVHGTVSLAAATESRPCTQFSFSILGRTLLLSSFISVILNRSSRKMYYPHLRNSLVCVCTLSHFARISFAKSDTIVLYSALAQIVDQ